MTGEGFDFTPIEQFLVANAIANENLQKLMAASALWGYRKGSLVVHYDNSGRIQKIESHGVIFPS